MRLSGFFRRSSGSADRHLNRQVKTISRFSLQCELLSIFLLVATIPLIVITITTVRLSSSALRQATYDRLEAIQAIKRTQVDGLFQKFYKDVTAVAGSQQLSGAMFMLDEFAAGLSSGNSASDGPYPLNSDYESVIYRNVAIYPREFIESYGYEDLILINRHGQIAFTVARGTDLGQNLRTGPLRDSGLAAVWHRARKANAPIFQDFSLYGPDDMPQSFIAAAIPADGSKESSAVVALKISNTCFDNIIQQRTGMGDSSRFSLVARDSGGGLTFRSDGFGAARHGVGARVTEKYLRDFLTQDQVSHGIYTDSSGTDMIVATMPLARDEVDWHIAAQVDCHDAMHAVSTQQRWALVVTGAGIAVILLAVLLFTGYINRNLNIILLKLKTSASEVEGATGGMAAASQALAGGASSQASSIEETSASLEELASMANNNADNAQQASALSSEARESAQEGSRTMEHLVQVMAGISQSSEEVANVARGIEEIAFQTNLLALNAAVEAARAGESGRGFAVVAEEVRNLAQRASEQARVTSQLISDSCVRTQDGSTQATRANEVLRKIVQGTEKALGLVSEIAAASKEQAQGIDQITRAVASMDEVVQQNSASAEETASSSSELSSQAHVMNEIVEELNEFVNGAQATSQTHPPPRIAPGSAAPARHLAKQGAVEF